MACPRILVTWKTLQFRPPIYSWCRRCSGSEAPHLSGHPSRGGSGRAFASHFWRCWNLQGKNTIVSSMALGPGSHELSKRTNWCVAPPFWGPPWKRGTRLIHGAHLPSRPPGQPTGRSGPARGARGERRRVCLQHPAPQPRREAARGEGSLSCPGTKRRGPPAEVLCSQPELNSFSLTKELAVGNVCLQFQR